MKRPRASSERDRYLDSLAGWRKPLLETAARWESIAAQAQPGSERRYYAEQRAIRFRQAAECLRDDRPAPVQDDGSAGREES